MTITHERPTTSWQTHPGWGITVDLTPQEVVQARQVKVHRRLIGLVLLLVLVLCVGASLVTRSGTAAAQRDYDQEQARTAQLASGAEEYAPITTMQTVTTQIKSELGAVMTQDVDLVNLMARIRQSLPAGLLITTESVLLSAPVPVAAPAPTDTTDPAAVAAAAAAAAAAAGPQVIGSVNIEGTGAQISDVTPFVSALDALRGVVDVLPVSVTQGETGTSFTISLNITDQLYTGRFDPAGAK